MNGADVPEGRRSSRTAQSTHSHALVSPAFKGRAENSAFPSPLLVVWSGLRADATGSSDTSMLGTAMLSGDPRPLPVVPVQVGKNTQCRTGSPVGSSSLRLVLTSPQGDAEAKARASAQHF